MTSMGKYQEEFEHLECIGRGGFGVVFKARDKLLDLTFAIKRIGIRHDSEASIQHVLREAKALASLDHHNIVKFNTAWIEETSAEIQEQVDKTLFAPFSSEFQRTFITTEYAAGSEKVSTDSIPSQGNKKNQYLYIQMELCEKGNLKDWLSSEKRTPTLCMTIFKQILSAVSYIHNQNLIHRDLKTTNIFFSTEDRIKIGDFGLVAYDSNWCSDSQCSETSDTQTEYVGTKLYMSPEMMARKEYDSKVDVYSLGLIFYELLQPFGTEMERINCLTDVKKNRFPSEFKNSFPSEYKIIQRMLLGDPSKRITVAKVMAELERISRNHDVPTKNYLEMRPTEFNTPCKFNLDILIKKSHNCPIYENRDTRLRDIEDIASLSLQFSHSLVIKLPKFRNGKYQINVMCKKLKVKNKAIIGSVENNKAWYITVNINVEYEKTTSNTYVKNEIRIFKVYSSNENILVQELKEFPPHSLITKESVKIVNLYLNCKLVPSHPSREQIKFSITRKLPPNVTLVM